MADFDEVRRKRVVYTLPGMDGVVVERNLPFKQVDGITLHADVYRPPGSDVVPVVICVAGSGPFSLLKEIKDSGAYLSYGELLAASGLGAVTFNHRSLEESGLSAVAEDVDDLVVWVRRHAADYGLDPDRLGLWAFSGGPPFGFRSALRDLPVFVHCLVAYYGPMDLRHVREMMQSNRDEDPEEFSPAAYIAGRADAFPPVFVAKAGLDRPWLNESIDRFVAEALAHNLTLDVMTHPGGQHAFDILDDDRRSHEIIARTLGFLVEHLKGEK